MLTKITIALTAAAWLAGCATSGDDGDDLASEDGVYQLSGAARKPRAQAIRDVAAANGLTNGVLLAGIASVETGLSHCWSEATWACKGPTSTYCGGPVIAGASDGPCSAQQGGLGMFQFDGGTYSQTLARDGVGILQLDGNIKHAVDFVVNIVIQEVAGVNTRAQALAWMNSIPIAKTNAKFVQWNAILACRYNGACGSASQAAKYRDATLSLYTEFGTGFWAVSGGGGGGGGGGSVGGFGVGFGAGGEKLVTGNDPAGKLQAFWVNSTGAIQHAVQAPWSISALGGVAKQLASSNNADGRIEVFYVGTDDKLYHRVQLADGSWSGELAVGATAHDVAVARNADGRLEAFFTDGNNAIQHLWQTAANGGWSTPAALGGSAKKLAAAANADGRLEVFYIGTTGQLLHRVQITGGWSGELTFGAAATDLAVGRNPDGRLEVFFVGANGAIAHAWQTAINAGWTATAALGGAGKRVTVGANADGRLEVIWLGTADQLLHRVQLGDGAWSGELAFGATAADFGVGRNADGRLELFYLSSAGAIGHTWQSAVNGNWTAPTAGL